MKIVLKNKSIDAIFIYILILFFGLNFMNMAAYIIIFLLIFIFLIAVKKRKRIAINKELMLLIVCFSVYYFQYIKYNEISFLYGLSVYFLSPIIAYIIGLNIARIAKINLKTIICCLATGYFIHGMLNFLVTPNSLLKLRGIIDYWSNSDLSATLQGTHYVLISSLFFYSIFISKNKICNLLIWFGTLFSIYASIQAATRTLIVIFTIVFLFNALFYIKDNKVKNNKKLIFISSLMIFMLIGIIMYDTNFLNVQQHISELPIFSRSDIESGLDTPRYTYAIESFSYVFSNFKGGVIITDTLGISYIHNMWLDTVNTVGLIPAILLIVYTFSILINLLRLIKSGKVVSSYKYIFISFYIAYFAEFFVEPILEGVPYFFASMCFINGLMFYLMKVGNTCENNLDM